MAQVRLEQTARVLGLFQRQLLEYAPGEPDAAALVQELKDNSCSVCRLQESCRVQGRLDEALLQGEQPVNRADQGNLRRLRFYFCAAGRSWPWRSCGAPGHSCGG